MKNYLTFFLFVFTFNLQAQIHTSGGANSGGDDTELENLSRNGKWAKQMELMKKFSSHIHAQNIVCKGSPQLTESRSFLDSYIHLSVYKNASLKSNDKCSRRAAFFKCLEDKEYKKQLSVIVKDEEFIPFLEKHYHISPKEASTMVEFFKKIDD